MKGLELPINMIVVVAIAVLVLIVVAAFFIGRVNPDEVNLRSAHNTGCNTLRSIHNCAVSAMSTINVVNYLPPGATQTDYPNGYPFLDVCSRLGWSDTECAKACGCPGTDTFGISSPSTPSPSPTPSAPSRQTGPPALPPPRT